MIEYVLGFAFRHDDSKSVLLIRKDHPSWQAGKLNGIGGHIEPGESAMGAMVREFKEEAGVEIPHEKWTMFGYIQGTSWKVHLFTSHTWEVDAAESQTPEKIEWHHADSLPGDVLHNIPWLVAMALHPPGYVFAVKQYGPNL